MMPGRPYIAHLAEEYRSQFVSGNVRAPHRLSVWLKRDDLVYHSDDDIRMDPGKKLVQYPNGGHGADIVKAHHEKWDGSGYPLGLKAEEIDICARIFAVADAFDAITSDRVYRKGKSYEAAAQELEARLDVEDLQVPGAAASLRGTLARCPDRPALVPGGSLLSDPSTTIFGSTAQPATELATRPSRSGIHEM